MTIKLGGFEAIVCKCGVTSKSTNKNTLRGIDGVRDHLKTCEFPSEECNEHGYVQDFLCGVCESYLCSVLILKEEFLK